MKILCEQKQDIFLCELSKRELAHFINAPRSYSLYSGSSAGFILNKEFEINKNHFKDDFETTQNVCEKALESMAQFSGKYMSFMNLLKEQIKEDTNGTENKKT